MNKYNIYLDQEKDIRENDRDRDPGEEDRQDINSKRGNVGQYWNEFIHQSEDEEVVQAMDFIFL